MMTTSVDMTLEAQGARNFIDTDPRTAVGSSYICNIVHRVHFRKTNI